MSQADSPSFIKACMLRISRCDATGATPAGATNAIITRNLIKFGFSPEIEAGTDYTQKDSCGSLAVTARDRDIPKRYTTTLEMVYPDPEVHEMLIAAPLITKVIGTTRTVSDGVTTNASTTISSATAAFTTTDVGNVVSGIGITVGTTIASVTSPTVAEMSAVASATGASISITLTAATRSIGVQAPSLGVSPTDNGVSLELWSHAYVGGALAPVNPYVHWAFPRSFWTPGDREFADARTPTMFTGFAVENANWGNGPFNDWADAGVPSSASLTRAWGWHRTATLPTPAVGYTATPTQA